MAKGWQYIGSNEYDKPKLSSKEKFSRFKQYLKIAKMPYNKVKLTKISQETDEDE